jgi:iron complex outermembrane receptor protein
MIDLSTTILEKSVMAENPSPSNRALATLMVAVFASPAAADDAALRNLPLGRFIDAISLEELANMVVTDTKVAQPLDSVTQKIVILHNDDIDRQPVNNRNLAEQVRHTSGQFVNVLSRNDANWGSYAGLGPKYNSYLLDGLPIDSFIDPMSLDSSVIERIEIHKGPASVLYSNYLSMDFAGNEAPLAGTTNLILKNRIDAPLTRVSLGAGSWDTWAGRAYHQGRTGNLSYFFGASEEVSDYRQYGAANSWLQTVDAPDFDKSRFFGNLSYELGRPDHTASLFVHQTRHEGDMGRPNRDFQHRYDTVNLTYNNALADNWHMQFKAGERSYERGFGNDNYPTDLALTSHDQTRQTIRPMDLTLSYLHGKNNLLTVGMDHQQVHYQTSNLSATGLLTRDNDVEADSTGFFLQEKLQWNNWIFRAGVRRNSIEHDYALLGAAVPAIASANWSKNLWSLGLRNNMTPDLALYANVGSSFMTPAAKQIGGTTVVGSGQLANPALQPESGIGRDLGIDWRTTPALNIGLRAFLNTVDSAIVDNVVSVTPSQTRSDNAGGTRSTGIELDLNYSASASLDGFANLTWTRTRVSNPTDTDQNGTEIPFAPETLANLGITANLPGRLKLSAYYHWVGRYFDSASSVGRQAFGDYGVLNLRLRQQWRPDIEFTLDLNNVGNKRFDMPWGFRDPGFNGFAAVSYIF